MNDLKFLDAAVEEAKKAELAGELPAGAVLVKDGEVIARSHSRTMQLNDPIAVPEMDCIRKAGRRADQSELTLYSTRYPDMLTAGTLIQFSIGKLVVGLAPEQSRPIELLRKKDVPLQFVAHSDCEKLVQR